MKKILFSLIIVCLFFTAACNRADLPDTAEPAMVASTDGATPQVAEQGIRFVTYKKTYRIRPFSWGQVYQVPIRNISNMKTCHGTIVATAYYRFQPIYSRDIQDVVLRPQEAMTVPVQLPIFHTPVASCLVTVKMIDEWHQGSVK